ncbi:MAG TPA: FAD/NAD(P)-binding oxidoreductase, partial [Marmoricola sp.]|nr:FAD/NAD(P)-binding oxidoreductase [Marmoricola sp.]
MIVVVGAGLAGLQTVVALRAQGYDGRLTLLGAEPDPPYDRPPLTKALLLGETDDSTLEADWAALDVDLRLGVRVTAVQEHNLGTDAGELAFDRCVLATGAQPRRLPGAGTTVRTKADALALRAAL